jgi:hypothetical protein
MSIETRIRCDRCGQQVEAGGSVLTLEAGSAPPRWPTRPDSGRPAIDLCEACLGALLQWLGQGPRQAGQDPARPARRGDLS